MAAISTTEVYDAPQAPLTESAPDIKSGIFTWKGRLGVLKYMAQSTVLMLAMIAIALVAALASGVSLSADTGTPQVNPIAMAIFLVALIPVLWISVVMLIKRLHDLNLSGWCMLLTLIPILGMLFYLFIICAPGMKEGNKFGPLAATAPWEKAVGIIGLALLVVCVIASVVALIAPSVMALL